MPCCSKNLKSTASGGTARAVAIVCKPDWRSVQTRSRGWLSPSCSANGEDSINTILWASHLRGNQQIQRSNECHAASHHRINVALGRRSNELSSF